MGWRLSWRRKTRPRSNFRKRPSLESLEDRTLMSAHVGISFAGEPNVLNYHNADTQIAVGPTRVVELADQSIGIFDKATGALLTRQTLASFFAPAASNLIPGNLYDIDAGYDAPVGRFVIDCLYRTLSAPLVSYTLFAVSNTSDPTAGFSDMHAISVQENNPSLGLMHGDFTKLGWNADAYTITMNMFSQSSVQANVQVLTIPKGPALDGDPSTLTVYHTDLPQSKYAYLMPALTYAAAPGDPQWFAMYDPVKTNTITLVKETGELGSTPMFTEYFSTVATSVPTIRSPQPGTTNTIDPGSRSYLYVAMRGNRIVVGHEVGTGTGGVTHVRWYDFSVAGAAPTLSQWGDINPGAGIFTYDPAVAIAPNGDIGITFMQSSANQYLSTYVAEQPAGAPAGTLDTPVEIAPGQVPYLSTRNGDYSGIAVDPVNGTFWGAAQYAVPTPPAPSNNWATWVANFASSAATQLGVSVSSTVAGTPAGVTVTALNGFGTVAGDYRGMVHFASADVALGLPADYTFTPADGGQHTFALSSTVVGSHSFTVTDTARSSVTGSGAIVVSPAAAFQLVFSGLPTSPITQTPVGFVLTALDAYGNVATGYTGAVQFSSDDPQAVLPANYTFTAADAGVHTFLGTTFGTTGSDTLQVADLANGSVAGSATLGVGAGTSPGDVGDTLAAAQATGLGAASGSYVTVSSLGDGATSAADVDLYQFQASPGSALSAVTSLPAGGSPADTYLRLFDALGNELASNDNDPAGGTLYSALTYTFTASGTYYLGVSGAPNSAYDPTTAGGGVGGSTGDYRLDLGLTSPADVGDTLTSAQVTGLGPLSGGYSAAGSLGDGATGAADVDLYQFQATAGSMLSATTALPTGGLSTDTYLRLFDASGNELASNDNDPAGGTLYSALSYAFTAAGTYYIGVSGSPNTAYNPAAAGSGVAGSTGDYQLALNLITPTLSIGDVSQLEGNSGTSNMTFTVSLSAASTQTVTMNYSVFEGTAVPGTDYTVIPNGTLTFNPGQLSQAISVPVVGNTLNEPNKTFFVNLSNPTNAVLARSQAVGTILNDDPMPTVSVANVSAVEGNSGSKNFAFVFKLSAASNQLVAVNYATADGTAVAGTDYKATSGTVSFTPGVTSVTVNVPVIGNTVNESDKTFFVNLSNPSNGVMLTPQAVGTILNDDSTVSIANVSVSEGNSGVTPVVFTVSLSSPVPAGSAPVVVKYATAAGTAVAGKDFVAQSGSISIGPGQSSGTITVLALGNTLNEPNKTFTVTLTSATNALLPAGTKATGTIQNDDPLPSLSVSNVTAAEGNSGTTNFTFTVSLSAASGQTVTVPYATADGTAVAGTDYTATSGTLTFKPGTTALTVNVPVIGNTVSGPNKTFSLNLGSPTNATIGTGQGTGTIVNDDPNPLLSISSVSAFEGNSGTTTFKFTVSLSAAIPTGGAPATVQYATADGTALAGTDYGATSGTLTFNPGVTSLTISVPVFGNTINESDKTFTINLSNPTNATLLVGQGLGTIRNDDSTVSVAAASAVQGSDVTGTTPLVFTVSLSSAVPANGAPVVVQYSTANGTAVAGVDYVAQSGSVSIGPGQSSGTVTVLVLGNPLNEPTKTFTLNLSSATNALLPSGAKATGTILNNNPAPALSIGNVRVAEGNFGTTAITFTVSLSAASGQTITVNYATADGSALAGTDYVAQAGTLTFKPGTVSQTVTILVYGNLNVEPDKTFFVDLSAPTNATVGSGVGTGTILNDDQ